MAIRIVIGLVLVGTVPVASAFGQRPDLSGRWVYNATQSDNPRDQMRGGDSTDASRGGGGRPGGFGGRRGRGGFGGGHGGFGGGRAGGRGGMSDDTRARMRQTMHLAFDAPHALTISETDSTVELAADSVDVLLLHSNGHKVKQKVEGGGDINTKARWHGNDLVVERSVSGGGKVVEDYLRSQDSKQLYVIVDFTGVRGRSIQFRRVYDPAPTSIDLRP
jgi:hypothetical protein